jgi:hypothetical protein
MKQMRTTFKGLFYIKESAKRKDGTAPIIARISVMVKWHNSAQSNI